MDNNSLKQLSVTTALNEMMKKGHFDICCIDKVARLLMVDPKGEAYDILSPLHCINFSDMPSELREEIPRLIKDCLGVEPTYQFVPGDLALRRSTLRVIEPEPESKPKSRGVLAFLGRSTG